MQQLRDAYEETDYYEQCDTTEMYTAKPNDIINRPSHYVSGRKYEPASVIADWELDFFLGNVVKYISRAGRKDNIVQDLEKAQWYMNKAVQLYKLKENK